MGSSDSLRASGKVFNPDMENGQELVKPKILRPGTGERKTCSGNPEQTRRGGVGHKREEHPRGGPQARTPRGLKKGVGPWLDSSVG